jgi:hypothetical protein
MQECNLLTKIQEELKKAREEKLTGKMVFELHFNDGGIRDQFISILKQLKQ